MKIFKKLITLTLCISIATIFSSSAFALSWSGSTDIGSNNPGIATGGFSVPYTSEKNLVGYRISVIDEDKNTVAIKDYLRGSNYYMTTYNKVLVSSSGEIQNKYQLKSNYNGTYNTVTKSFETYSSLPDVDSIKTWIINNADTLLKKMGMSGGTNDMYYGDRLIVEPLFMVVINNEKLTMTISDIAIVGSQVFGKTGNVYSQGWSDGTWGFVSNYTQKYFPNYLHTDSDSSLWSDLWGNAPTLSSIATFGTILDNGYGVGVAFQNTTAKYTITYNSNTSDAVSNMPLSQTKTHGVTLALSGDTPTRTGYTFQGWSTSSGTNNTVNYSKNASYTTNASDILYAVWKANTYTVSYNSNTTDTVSNMPSSQTKTYGVTLTLRSDTPTRTGYTFQGWSTSSGTSNTVNYAKSASYTTNASDILYAVWKINACTITLNANGGTLGTTTSYTVDYGGTVSLWSASWATRTGYTFLGYSTNPNATTAEFLPRYTTNSNIYTITESDIWYAVWKVNTDIYPEFVEPNATYYSGIDIIASFNIVNDGAIDFTQSSGIDVNLEVYSVSHSGISTLILDNEKSIVIPKYEENLVYWKVSI
ncbi:MAG: InlB B-repeat-containing protein, partial [Clostridia bacterium]